MKKSLLILVACCLILCFLINVSAVAQPFTTSMTIKNTYCNIDNGVARVIPSSAGIYTYLWSSGSLLDSVDNLSIGMYFVTVSRYDSMGGSVNFVVRDTAIIDTQNVLAIVVSRSNPTCGADNGVINVGGTGGTGAYTFQIVKSGINYSSGTGLAVGRYKLVVVDNLSGCISDSVTVTLVDSGSYFQITDTLINSVNCLNQTTGAIFLTITGGVRPYSFTWTGFTSTDSFLVGLSQGIFVVNIRDALCPTIRSFNIVVPGPTDSLKVIVSSKSDTCLNAVGSATASAIGGTGPFNFIWSNGSTANNIGSLVAGSYYVNVVDDNGCKDSIDFSIRSVGGPSARLIQLDSSCVGESNGKIRVKVVSRDGPFHYTWNFDSTKDTNYIKDLSAGFYSVTITNAAMCDTVINISLEDYYMPTLQVIGDTSIIQGQFAFLSALTVPDYDSIFWTPSISIVSVFLNALASPLQSMTYTAFVRYENGCYLMDTVTVLVDSVALTFVIPNIFTPNGDGINDLLKLLLSESVKSIEMHIFDRWGNKIFDSFSKERFWDGKNQNTGKEAEIGVYSYFIYIQSLTDVNRILKEGNITLLR